MPTTNSRDLLFQISLDLFAFCFGLGLAYCLKWQTVDLVWSLWLSSLVFGYLTIILGIGLLVLLCTKTRSYLTSFIIALFLLAFFTIHFGGFHAGHAFFLDRLFPVSNSQNGIWIFLKELFSRYGIFLVPILISERSKIIYQFNNFNKIIKTDFSNLSKIEQNLDPKIFGEAIFAPYLNVARMHLLIFFFIFCHISKIDSFLVYTVVYFVYFFPFKIIYNRNT